MLRARSKAGPSAGPSRDAMTTATQTTAPRIGGSLRGLSHEGDDDDEADDLLAKPRRRATANVTLGTINVTPLPSPTPQRSRGGSIALATTPASQVFSSGSVMRYGALLPILFRTVAAVDYFSKRADAPILGPQQLTRGGLIADLVLCVLSMFGAIGIIMPYIVSKNSRKLRHSLILGLATSDLASSIIIIISTAYLLEGGNLSTSRALCDFLGYTLAVSIFTQHCWNLCIAVITYMIVVHPLSNFILTIERYLLLLWPIIWIFALAINGVAWGVAGWSNAAGYCGTGPKAGPLFGPIFIFVPRAFVFIVIIVLYTHLFLWLRRSTLFRDTGGGSSHRSSRNDTTQHARTGGSAAMALSRDVPGSPMPSRTPDSRRGMTGPGSTPTVIDDRRRSATTGTTGDSSAKAASSGLTSDTACKDGGMELELQQMPVTKLRGSPASLHQSDWTFESGKECLSTAATAPLLPEDSISPKSQSSMSRAADGERSMAAPAPELPMSSSSSSPTGERELKPSAASSASRASSSSTSVLSSDAHGGSRIKRPNTAGERHPEGHRPAPLKIPPRPSTAGGHSTLASSRVNAIAAGITGSPAAMGPSWSGQGETMQAALASTGSEDSEDEFFQRMSPRRDVRDFKMVTAPREHLNHYTLTASGKQTVRQAIARMTSVPNSAGAAPATGASRANSGFESPRGTRAQTDALAPSSDDRVETTLDVETALGEGWTWGMAVGGAAPPPGVAAARRGSATPSITLPKTSEREKERNDGYRGAKDKSRSASASSATAAAASGGGRSHRHHHHPRGATSLWALLFKRHQGSYYHSSSSSGGEDTVNSAGSGSNSTAFDEEHGVERVGSTLNRQASILMLLYPLAYCLLFSISIGRLIFDLVQNAKGKRVDNTDALHSVARWFVFIQGAWDFAIFSLVERAFRNRMKRRRRREAGEAIGEGGPAWLRWTKAFTRRS